MGFFGVCDDGGFLTLSHVEDYSTKIFQALQNTPPHTMNATNTKRHTYTHTHIYIYNKLCMHFVI